ncbi:MAG TPA: glycosyltransferase [Burkholderiales bacterium]|nr:glycosyltransferase [Burkholderiales bacterium]
MAVDDVNVLLVDASLFTPAYDAALTRALLDMGIKPSWATRPLRQGDRPEIPPECTDAFFYRRTDGMQLPARLRAVLKGCAHLAGMLRLVRKVRRERPDAVHFQWIVVPLVDALAMALIRRWCPVVLTVHDTVAHNGQKLSWPQQLGYDWSAKLAHHVIVHTRSGLRTLAARGVPPERIRVIPHGPLALPVATKPAKRRDGRWTAVLFGEIKPYKGLDVLIDAVAAMPSDVKKNLRVIVAGRPRMDMAPLLARIRALGLADLFDLRLRRQSDEEMAALFAEADGFVFPYRQIDASGVYHLIGGLGKWLIASRVGVFAEDGIDRDGRGVVVPPEDAPALASALAHAVTTRPRASAPAQGRSWSDIARATCALYARAAV